MPTKVETLQIDSELSNIRDDLVKLKQLRQDLMNNRSEIQAQANLIKDKITRLREYINQNMSPSELTDYLDVIKAHSDALLKEKGINIRRQRRSEPLPSLQVAISAKTSSPISDQDITSGALNQSIALDKISGVTSKQSEALSAKMKSYEPEEAVSQSTKPTRRRASLNKSPSSRPHLELSGNFIDSRQGKQLRIKINGSSDSSDKITYLQINIIYRDGHYYAAMRDNEIAAYDSIEYDSLDELIADIQQELNPYDSRAANGLVGKEFFDRDNLEDMLVSLQPAPRMEAGAEKPPPAADFDILESPFREVSEREPLPVDEADLQLDTSFTEMTDASDDAGIEMDDLSEQQITSSDTSEDELARRSASVSEPTEPDDIDKIIISIAYRLINYADLHYRIEQSSLERAIHNIQTDKITPLSAKQAQTSHDMLNAFIMHVIDIQSAIDNLRQIIEQINKLKTDNPSKVKKLNSLQRKAREIADLYQAKADELHDLSRLAGRLTEAHAHRIVDDGLSGKFTYTEKAPRENTTVGTVDPYQCRFAEDNSSVTVSVSVEDPVTATAATELTTRERSIIKAVTTGFINQRPGDRFYITRGSESDIRTAIMTLKALGASANEIDVSQSSFGHANPNFVNEIFQQTKKPQPGTTISSERKQYETIKSHLSNAGALEGRQSISALKEKRLYEDATQKGTQMTLTTAATKYTQQSLQRENRQSSQLHERLRGVKPGRTS